MLRSRTTHRKHLTITNYLTLKELLSGYLKGFLVLKFSLFYLFYFNFFIEV